MSELVTDETVQAVESLGIPGVNAETMRKVGSAQRIARQRRVKLSQELGIPNLADKYSLRQYLPAEIFAEIKKREPNLTDQWRNFFWLMNNEIGLLLIDGSPAPLSKVTLSELPKWTRVGVIDLAVSMPENPKYASVIWKMGSECREGKEYTLPSLSSLPRRRTSGLFPLSVGKIHVFGNQSFTLVKTYEPWKWKLSHQS